MFGKRLKSTTALVMAVALTAPHPTLAQNILTGDDGTKTELKEKLDRKMKDVKDLLGEGAQENAAPEAKGKAKLKLQGNADAQGNQGQGEQVQGNQDQGTTNLQVQGDAGARAQGAAQGQEQGQKQVNKLKKQLEQGVTGQAAGEADAAAARTTGQGQKQVNKLKKQLEQGLTGQAAGEADAADARTTGQGTAEQGAQAGTQAQTSAQSPAEEAAPQQTAKDKADALREALEAASPELPEIGAEQKQQALQKAERDNAATLSSEEQARQAAKALSEPLDAAALTGEGEIVDEAQTTVTEEMARSSSEAFETDLTGRQRAAAAAAAQDDDDDDLLKALGVAAVAGLGAYAVGQFLRDGSQVVANTGDRIVVEQDGHYRVIKDDNALLRRPGNEVKTDTFADGSTRTVVTAPDGARTITVRAADGRLLQRIIRYPDGQEVVLIDDTRRYSEVDVNELSRSQANIYDYSAVGQDELAAALQVARARVPDRAYSLYQVRNVDVVRKQVPVITLDAINFETNSAAIQPREAEELAALGQAMREAIDRDPRQIFLVEGHTDTVGKAAYNLALSDRRAESVALALTEYFDVPPENMVIQGYGETDLKVHRQGDIRANRRAAVRNITPLLTGGT